jgi:hypothetical protein
MTGPLAIGRDVCNNDIESHLTVIQDMRSSRLGSRGQIKVGYWTSQLKGTIERVYADRSIFSFVDLLGRVKYIVLKTFHHNLAI